VSPSRVRQSPTSLVPATERRWRTAPAAGERGERDRQGARLLESSQMGWKSGDGTIPCLRSGVVPQLGNGRVTRRRLPSLGGACLSYRRTTGTSITSSAGAGMSLLTAADAGPGGASLDHTPWPGNSGTNPRRWRGRSMRTWARFGTGRRSWSIGSSSPSADSATSETKMPHDHGCDSGAEASDSWAWVELNFRPHAYQALGSSCNLRHFAVTDCCRSIVLIGTYQPDGSATCRRSTT
jgi:hypothetical protein